MKEKRKNRYSQIIESIFFEKYKKGLKEIPFDRQDLIDTAEKLNLGQIKNIGDIPYTFRYRGDYPEKILTTVPEGYEWIIRPAGKAKYKFALVEKTNFKPSSNLAETKIPDATPGIIVKYALGDEQALLAKLRFNRLIDIFTGLTCYSLQNHLRTSVEGMGQVETDEIYIGIDKRGAHYVLPVQAKGGKDNLGIVQIEQDFGLAAQKFPNLICKPIAAQFMSNSVIALFEMEKSDGKITIASEKHYRLVHPEELTSDELKKYGRRVE